MEVYFSLEVARMLWEVGFSVPWVRLQDEQEEEAQGKLFLENNQ